MSDKTKSIIRPSLLEVAMQSKRALIMGLGGGGDVIQGIPLARLFRQLTLRKSILAA